jgi:peptidoglycan glycosyltransferase
MDTANSRILQAFIFVGLLFAMLIGSLTWFELQGKNHIMTSTYNRRLMVAEEKILRGSILDRNGEVLAETQDSKNSKIRLYPYDRLYAHVIGYDSLTYGKTMLEARYNDALLGKRNLEFWGKVETLISGEPQVGYNLRLTLSHTLQQIAKDQLEEKKGAVVALNPKTGEILALVSTPDYNPNADKLEERWSALIEDKDSPLLPRATMGLYPPGSTFKIITAAAALNKGLGETVTEDQGSTVIDGMTFKNAGNASYGEIGLLEAFTVSSNVYFAEIAQKIGADALIKQAESAGIGQKFDFDLPRSVSRIGVSNMGKTELSATGIGQGKLMVSPLQMALIGAGVANRGTVMQPYIVGSIEDASGKVLKSATPKKIFDVMDENIAQQVTEMMVQVVNEGTGTRAQISGVDVAGKTGTAQNEKSSEGEGNDHAWFVGFAPAEDPQIVVAVLLEYQGQGGGRAAAPIARKVMLAWLKLMEAAK